jgi:hypothetical protein
MDHIEPTNILPALFCGWETAEVDRDEAEGLQKYNKIHITF